MCSRLGILSCCKVLFVNLLYSQRGGLLNLFIRTVPVLSYRGYGLVFYIVEKVNSNIDYNLK